MDFEGALSGSVVLTEISSKESPQGQLLLLLSLKPRPFSSLPFPGAGNSSENSRILVTFLSPKMGWWLIFLAFKTFLWMFYLHLYLHHMCVQLHLFKVHGKYKFNNLCPD